ncbi:SDR family NAD(P)-dependent oxidoreductase [Streptomyces sp. B93]|uniref:SDR family NAD(P)-dependent oxidoreductase n=1 Tax=Streptomyces sp. B93 TaxID=2824875 RepID=UPI002494FC8E|nr:SDR family NAD(P)-dependent oxidoreductase [Streptomyces sp. B93]
MRTGLQDAKREILARVSRGELDARQAAALLRRLTAEEPATVWYEATWTPPAPVPHTGPADPRVLVLRPGAGPQAPDGQGRFVVPADAPVDWRGAWRAVGGGAGVVFDVREASGAAALDAAFALLRTVVEDDSRQPVALAVLTAGPGQRVTADALGGLCQIAAQEDRRVHAVAVHSADAAGDGGGRTPLELAAAELSLPAPGSRQVRHGPGGRATRTLTPLEPAAGRPWRDGGVHLVTGGAGGLGAHVALLLARRHAARLVLLGRSAPTERVERLLDRLREAGGAAVYVQGDVTRHADVERAVARAHEEFGPLTGVLHAAGVNEDAYLVNKEPETVRRVLAPKITGAAVLDEVTAAEPLESFVLLSSVAAYTGGPGQSDYAAANRALGALAAARAQAAGRRGTTVALALPLTEGGGMDLSERDKRAVHDLQGMTALPADALLDTIAAALATGRPEVYAVHGDADRVRAYVTRHLAERTEETRQEPAGGDFAPAVERYLLALVGDILRLPEGRLRADQELSTVGVDSVLIKKIHTVLEDRLGPLPATLLFEYRTVGELAHHLAAEHTGTLRALLAPGTTTVARTAEPDRPRGTPAAAPTDEPIAVIGVAGRYPGGRDLDAFWRTLRDGEDAVTEVPADRWDHSRYYVPGERGAGTVYAKWGGFIEDADRFDARYFNISPRDAERADPTERVFLEVAWSALEDAGYSRRLLHERTRRGEQHAVGVFVGATATSYKLIGAEEWGRGHRVIALSMDFSIANRLSYLLDAHGPSLVVDTACSSSLTALHLAVESLRRGECAMAIAGGAHIQTHPIKYGVLADMRLLSTDGRCRAFGAGGDGFVPSEGAGALILKPLSAARADGDHIHGVILATSLNHGGRTNGYTVPSPRSHAQVISAALRDAGVTADTIGYVEAHGTGTALGDPIEIEGLRRAFAEHTDRVGYCAIGSAKSNIGHAESAAGVAGITKVLLQFAHRRLAPTLHADEPNPKIDFSTSPFVLQRGLAAWERLRPDLPRRAAVSSFGAGGANGHVILEEPPDTPHPDPVAGPDTEQLVVLSAKTDERLREVVRRLHRHLESGPAPALRDLAHTLATGRDELDSRLAVTARTPAELHDRLGEFLTTGAAPGLVTGRVDPTAEPPADPARTRALLAARDLGTLARLWTRGATVDWTGAHDGARRVPLPTYPFAGDRHWVATTPPLAPGAGRPGPLHRVVPTLEGLVHEADLARDDRIVADHVVQGRALLAGVVQLQLAVAAVEGLERGGVREITDVRWRTPVEIPDGGTTVRVALTAAADGALDYTIGVRDGRPCSTGTLHPGPDPAERPPALDLDAIRARCATRHDGPAFYTDRAEHAGLAYGPLFRRLAAVHSGPGGEALGELTPAPGTAAPDWAVDAGTLDGALHALHGVLPEPAEGTAPFLPASVARVALTGRLADARHVHVRLLDHDPERGTARADVTLTDPHGVPVAAFHDLRAARPTAHPEPTATRSGTVAARAVATAVREETGTARAGATGVRADTAAARAGTVAARSGTVAARAVATAVREETTTDRAGASGVRAETTATRAEAPAARADTAAARADATPARPGTPAVRHLRTAWEVLDTPTPAPAPHTGHTLILTTARDLGLGQALAARSPRARVLRLDTADAYRHVGPAVEALDDDSVLYFLGGIDDRRYGSHDLAHLDTALDQGCLALYRLAGRLAARRPEGLRLTVVTSDSQQTDEGVPARNPYAAALVGLAKSLARELPSVSVSCLDLDRRALAHGGTELDRLAAAVLAEPGALPVREVALRGRIRLGKTLRPVTLPDVPDAGLPLRHGGTYLLVGGAGGLGRAVARYLARAYAARLVLVGRRPLAELPGTLLSDLRDAGGEAVYEQADITDRDAVGALLTRVRARFGAVNGAVHAAFTLADGLLHRMDEATFRAALHAKTHGTVVLAEALAGEPLDFLALFSSAVSHRANAGQGNYSAASTFQDAYAHHLAARTRLPVKLLNWGLWSDSGSVATEDYRRRVARLGVAGLTDEEGIEAFRRVLGAPLTQATVLKTTGDQPLEGVSDTPADALDAPGDGQAVREAVAGATEARRDSCVPPGYLARLDDLARREVLAALHRMGAPRSADAARIPSALAADLGVDPGQRRLFEALLDMLRGPGLLRDDDGRLSFPTDPYPPTDADDRTRLTERLVADHPHCAPTVDLIADCAAALPDVLTGRRRGLEVLFPGGSQHRIAALYHDDPRSRHFNAMCTAAVVRRVTELRRRQPGRPVSVLEIGAGTGGTTRPLLAALQECEGGAPAYVCTDISPALVRQTAERLGADHPEAVFRTLDIAADPAEQGFAGERYDIVVAANVLHATGDIRATLRHVASLMRPGALLAVTESTAVLDAVTLVFGLTDGWWLYGDGALRLPYSPLFAADDWGALLAEAGLRGIRALSATGDADADADQSLVLAERGTIRPQGAHPETGADPAPEPEPAPATAVTEAPTMPVDQDHDGRTWLVDRLRTRFAASLKLDAAELETHTPLLDYGVDSLVVMEATEALGKDLGQRVVLDEPLTGLTLTEAADLLLAKGVTVPAPAAPVVRPTPDRPRPEPSDEVPVAVVGIAGRYPGADDLWTFWDNLRDGRRAIGEIPADRWHAEGQGGAGVRWGAFLTDVDRFDPLLFRISPREAAAMDPQERQLLQTAWTALEDAGTTRARLETDAVHASGAGVGVFTGAMHTPYQALAADRRALGERPDARSAHWSLANRLSHCFGFSGPSVAVDTACSSSLTALHLACESLRRGDCGAAVVGGVNLILHPAHHEELARARMLSDDGHARAFDRDGGGMVTGEGVGVVVLKPLPEALRAGDRVHALIVGSAVNHTAGDDTYTTPDAGAQAALLRRALHRAHLGPDDIQYVEAAATGAPVGDAVEAEALREVFAARDAGRGPVRVGSLKPGIGHLEAASGMAQLTKVLLQFRAGQLAPTLDVTTPVPAFSADGSPLALVRRAEPWEPTGHAVVSSFGVGGANAQLIVAAPPPPAEVAQDTDGPLLVPLSARRPAELARLAARLRDFLRGPGADAALADVAHTLRVGREPLRTRAVLVVRDVRELAHGLGTLANGGAAPAPDLAALPPAWAAAARRWTDGEAVDWRELDGTGRVISLPGYPFARDRHWLPEAEPEPVPQAEAQPAPIRPPVSEAAHVVAPTDDVYDIVAAAISGVLGLPTEEVGPEEHLSDFGFDSVTITELASVLSDRLGMGVLAPELYAHTDVASLVAALAARAPVPPPPAPATADTAPAPPAAEPADEPIAVVGMAGRFPGSPDLDAYWANLVAGRDLVDDVPQDRFDWRDIHGDPAEDPQRVPSRWGGFLDGVDRFDADFFRISPREARTMDPQHRLFLQAVWHAIEDAGHDPASLEGSRTGVFVGVGSSEYAQLLIGRGVEIDGQAATGNAHSVLANRVSFLLGLHGPSEPVDTACSSSLTAVHRAVQAIRAGECEAAVAGGVNVILSPTGYLAFGKSGMLSPDGRCKTFDHRADGYVRGEGVAAVLLKPLGRALADGDHVHALIRGTAVNHGGRANSLTAPNPQAQTDVIVRAHRAAGVTADTVTYVEAHGTGTALGDPIEVNGLVDAFRELGADGRTGYCALGSVKTNVGHLETAAGIAGLIKVIKALQHRTLPPSLHLRRVNPLIDLTTTPFRLVDERALSDVVGGP